MSPNRSRHTDGRGLSVVLLEGAPAFVLVAVVVTVVEEGRSKGDGVLAATPEGTASAPASAWLARAGVER